MKLWIVFVFAMMSSCVASPAMADDTFILHVGGWSKHFGFDTSNITNENLQIAVDKIREDIHNLKCVEDTLDREQEHI